MNPHQLLAGFLGKLARHAIRRPRTALMVAAGITLAAAPGMFRLTLRTDGHALVSPDAPEVHYDQSIRDQFGIEDEIVVLIRAAHTNGIFNPATLQLVRDLTADFQKLPGINPSNIVSLATEPSFRKRPGTINPQRLLEPPLKTQTELELLREDLRRIELYTGTLVSVDGQSTAILIGTPADCDRTRFYEQLKQMIAARQPVSEEIAVTGAPIAESLLGIHILEDLGVPQKLLGASTRSRAEQATWKAPANLHELKLFVARRIGLVPVTILVMVLVFFVTFRNPLATLVPLPGIVATLASVFGLMGWAGVPVYLTTAVMPVLLVATGVTNDIYLFTRYFNLLRENPGKRPAELLGETFDKLSFAVAITSLTTGIGFFFLRVFTHRTGARLWCLGRRRCVAGFVLFADRCAGDAVIDSASLAAVTPAPGETNGAFPAGNTFRKFRKQRGALALDRSRLRRRGDGADTAGPAPLGCARQLDRRV